jgi:ResB-like family
VAAQDQSRNPLLGFFGSLRLTVVCLALALVLVFWGTLAQVELGLYKAQNEFFRSFFIYWGPKGGSWRIPIFPGGYLIGGVLLINLVVSQLRRFTFSASKVGLWMVHFGLILLLLGQLLTDLLSRESVLHLREGEAKNYSETERNAELAITDVTDPDADRVVAIPQNVLAGQKSVQPGDLPFTVRVKQFLPNSRVQERASTATEPPAATQGAGAQATLQELPRETEMDKRDVPSAIVEVVTPQGSLGTWLVSEYVEQPQSFTWNNRTYQLAMRPHRDYKPYSIQLLKFQHDVYAGTDIPKNFSSRILLERPSTGEKREVLVKMNSPLRYAGETYYQASYDPDDKGSILQVVHNPSWLTPYLSCVLVGAGLVIHFATHLLGFAFRRRDA